MKPGELIYEVAKGSIGKDMGGNMIPDALSCAISVNNIVQQATGKPIGGGASTYNMYRALKLYSTFLPGWRFYKVRIERAKPGDIIISPTGYGNGKLSNGHVGIIGMAGEIMSNTSFTTRKWKAGTWQYNHNISNWTSHYGMFGGFPVEVFRVVR